MYFPVLSVRLPIVIGMFPIELFRSRYPVIPISFSRPAFLFSFPFPIQKCGCGNGLGFFQPFSTVCIPSRHGAAGQAPRPRVV